MARWNFKLFGTAIDPIHKSHLNSITGDYGCLTQFRFSRDERADAAYQGETRVSGKAALGTAAHETIARALQNKDVLARVLSGSGHITEASVRSVLNEELSNQTNGRKVGWFDDDPEDLSKNRTHMISGLLNDLHHHVSAIEMLEPGFIVRLGEYWLSGHIDLVYRPAVDPQQIGTADWKTGAQKPDPIELDHGWESGIYSAAVHEGMFLSRAAMTVEQQRDGSYRAGFANGIVATRSNRYEAERAAMEQALIDIAVSVEAGTEEYVPTFGAFPAEIRHVHLADYVPYSKVSKKQVKRPEEMAFYGLDQPGEVKTKIGDQRGPAWYRIRRTEHDIPRLQHQLRNVIGTIRMGRFYDSVGEKCKRCPFKEPCLNTGYGVLGAERKDLERSLRVLDNEDMFDGLGTAR